MLFLHPGGDVDAAGVGHAHVEDGNIRLMLRNQGLGRGAVGCLGHDRHVWFVFQEVTNALAYNGVFICQYDSYHYSAYLFLR